MQLVVSNYLREAGVVDIQTAASVEAATRIILTAKPSIAHVHAIEVTEIQDRLVRLEDMGMGGRR
ncbi:hypothetical protein [Alsobacter metallidurans]|uniref:hypothetical protein n=1 Tax=Alsobacter metallidurans TaxID=340221 RepID=UPI001AEE8139|nr:hypothetical protein [Alsobacter metallidurans]